MSFVSLFALTAPVAPAHAETALSAIEDAYVDSTSPTSNFGSATLLSTDGTPRATIYLKFNASSLPTSSSAALRVYVTNDADTSFEVRKVSDTSWSESTITAANAPPVGEVVATSGPVRLNTWHTVDVSDALQGAGLVTLAITTASPKTTMIHSRENTNAAQLVTPAPPNPSPFVVWHPAPGSSDYIARSASTETSYVGTLKSVVERAADDLSRSGGGIVHFNAGLYDLGDSQFELTDMAGVTFEGEGMDVTTIANSRTISADTEVFDVARATRGGMRDLTVSAGGPARTTSDAVDYDAGSHQVIERVKVIRSRSRGIVFDGKDVMGGLARGAQDNVIRDCVVTGVPGDGIELLAARDNRIEGCTITRVGGHGIQAVKASPAATLPNEQARNNAIVGNFVEEAGLDGINILSGEANQVLGNTVRNSGNTAPDRDGIRIASADAIACDNNVVSGNTATDTQSPKTQRYGLAIASDLCHGTFVSNNDFAGNLVGEILDYGTGTTYGAPEPTPDVEAPSVPTGLTARAVGPTQVDLTWSAAVDNVAVAGYTIYRAGTAIGTVGAATTSFQDTRAAPDTTYTYAVDAFDGAANRSAQSAPATATTPALPPPGPGVTTFVPTDDAHVSSNSKTTNFGSQPALRLDAKPETRSYLKFNVGGIDGTITRAMLRLHANSPSTTGFTAHMAGHTAWAETSITYANAPPVGSTLGSSGSFASGGYATVDVTSLIKADGTYAIVLTTTSKDVLSLASRETANSPQLVVEAEGTSEPPPPSDTEPPSVPADLTATAAGPTTVDLAWTASTDNGAVAGYTIYRDGAAIATVGGTAGTFTDTTVSPSTTYTYAVDAFDASSNRSLQSAAVQVTTPDPPPAPRLFTFAASADAYVTESAPTTNNGYQSELRLDAAPVVRSYLRFSVSGVSGTISRAKLRLYANSSSITGYEAHLGSDTTWGELTLTYANAPAFGPAVISSGALSSGAYTEVDVTPIITGDGTYTIVLTAPGTTALSLGSRESPNAPQLVIEAN